MKIKIQKQNYLKKILLEFPSLSSGRKNYDYQYLRILKNILLSKLFSSKLINKNTLFIKKCYFKKEKNFIKIDLNNNQ